MQTKAAILYDINSDLKVEKLSLSNPRTGEVLVQMGAAGICHSDFHVISGQASQKIPCVLGHEGAGKVISVGENVTRVSQGDHVILSWLPYCGNCYQCNRGRTHLCKALQDPVWDGTLLDGTCRFSNDNGEVRQLGTLGCWSEFCVVPQECCVTIKKSVPFEIAALLGCAVTTGVGAVLNRAKITEGQTVVIIGMGGVGLSVLMGAKMQRASKIICVDTNSDLKGLALSLGGTHFIEADKNTDVLLKIQEITEVGADHVFEAVGKRDLQKLAIDYCCPGGQVTFVGLDGPDASIALPTTEITRSEKTITGSIYGSACTDRDFILYADAFLSGELPIGEIVGRHYKIDKINEAISDMLIGKPGRGVISF